MFVENPLAEVIVKGLHADLENDGYRDPGPHGRNLLPVHPVGFEKQLPDALFSDDADDLLLGLGRQLEAAAGVDDLQHAEFAGDLGKNLGIERRHLFGIPAIVIDVIAEAAFPPGAGEAAQQADLPLVFVCDAAVTLGWDSHMNLLLVFLGGIKSPATL